MWLPYCGYCAPLEGGATLKRELLSPGAPSMRLAGMLGAACPEDLCVLAEPAVRLTSTTEFDPDLVVVAIDEVGGSKFTRPPLLVVEVRSPSTALIDLNQKKAAYERFGVPSYWLVDPDLPQPELTVLELRDGHYSLVGVTTAPLTVTVDRPFRVTIDPANLTRGLPSRSAIAGRVVYRMAGQSSRGMPGASSGPAVRWPIE